jgi:hypothetical protein
LCEAELADRDGSGGGSDATGRACCEDTGSVTGLRREQRLVLAAIAAAWSVFFIQAWQATTLLDDWFQLGWCKGRELDLEKLEKELGDALWCLAMTAKAAGLSLDAIAAATVKKLEERHPDRIR